MEVGATISIKGLKGIIRYVGEYHEKPGIYVGVELEKPKGKNNGTIKGKKYFECPENHGLFVDLNTAQSIMKIVAEGGETPNATPQQSPRIDLDATSKVHPISKSIDSIKSSNNSPATSIMKKPGDHQKQTTAKGQPNSNLTSKSNHPNSQPHSAREVTFVKQHNKTTNVNNLNSPLTQGSTTTTPTKAPSVQSDASPSTASQSNSNSPARRASITPSQSNPGLVNSQSSSDVLNPRASIAQPNTKVQSARQANQNQMLKTSSSRDSNLKSEGKSDSSENVLTKPSSATSKASTTPEKNTAPSKAVQSSSKTVPTTANTNKIDSEKVQSARVSSGHPKQNQPQMPNSARETPTKQLVTNSQNSPLVSQQAQQPNTQNPQTPQNQNNAKKASHPAVPPLSIPLITIEESVQSKESAASVSFEEIKSKIPVTAASAMPSANREKQIHQKQIQQSTDLPITTTSADQSVENSPRQAKQLQTVITPEIQTKIKELNAKLEGYKKQKALIRQKSIDIASAYKKKKVEQEKYLLKLSQDNQKKLIDLEISLETDINELENQILESAERTHRYLEIADEQRASKVMDLLRQINEEHVNFENDLDLFINAQRINVNTAIQSVHILTERLKKVLVKKQINDKLIVKKKSIIVDRENELAEKRPRWQEVTELRTTFSNLSEKVNYAKRSSTYKNAEREGMERFYQMFSDVPLLDSLYLVLCIEKKTENNEIRHICELTKFVLSGFITNTTKSYDLFNALTDINDSLGKNEITKSLLTVNLALDNISSVPLENVLSSFLLKASAEKIKDEKLKNQVLDIIGEIKNSPLIHFALLEPSKKEDFIDFSKNLLFELKKAEAGEEDEECNIEQFKGQLEKFNVPEIDVIKGFIDFQMPQQIPQDKQKILPEIVKKRQEKKDIEAKSKFLQEEIEKEKEKFEALRAELAEPMKEYMELVDQLEAVKKNLDKYSVQNE